MDPNLFAVDGARLFEVLVTIVILSFFVERALALLFETSWFVTLTTQKGKKGIKEPIAFALSFAVCHRWNFDALSIVLAKSGTLVWGQVITAAIIAGGSKASIKLFHDVLNAKSSAEAERQDMARVATAARMVAVSGAVDVHRFKGASVPGASAPVAVGATTDATGAMNGRTSV